MTGSLAFCLFATVSSSTKAQQQTAPFHLTAQGLPLRLAVGPVDGSSSRGKTDEQIFNGNLKLAQSGNPEAAFMVGIQYAEGIGTAHAPLLAEEWLSRGAVKPDDKLILAQLYVGGWYFDQDAAKADHWFRSAGRPSDLFELAEMYRTAIPSQVALAAPIYRQLLSDEGHPEARRAQMELGNFVLDGTYRLDESPDSHHQELEWARSITQELLGQVEYNIALDFQFGREDVPQNSGLWARYCALAAAYNVDLAQQFLSEGMLQGTVPGGSFPEAYAWLRLASEKQTALKRRVAAWEMQMDAVTQTDAQLIFTSLEATRRRDGAYYRSQNPLRSSNTDLKETEVVWEPDLAVRTAYQIGQSDDPTSFQRALDLYREVRDQRAYASALKLGKAFTEGTDGLQKNAAVGRLWFVRAAAAGSAEAKKMLANTR